MLDDAGVLQNLVEPMKRSPAVDLVGLGFLRRAGLVSGGGRVRGEGTGLKAGAGGGLDEETGRFVHGGAILAG